MKYIQEKLVGFVSFPFNEESIIKQKEELVCKAMGILSRTLKKNRIECSIELENTVEDMRVVNVHDYLGNKETLIVNKKKFIGWYFDKDMRKTIIERLCTEESISLGELLQDLSFLPLNLIENKEAIKEKDIEDHEIKSPHNYNLVFET